MSRLKSYNQAGTAPEYIRFKLNGLRRLITRLYEAEIEIISDVTSNAIESGLLTVSELRAHEHRAKEKRDYIKQLIDHLEQEIEEKYT